MNPKVESVMKSLRRILLLALLALGIGCLLYTSDAADE